MIKFISLKAFYNEVVATHPKLESVLIPIGDGMTVSRVKK
ncbi:methyltransferase [Bacillus luti]|nr:methyltransferase [Bacillus luti]